MVYIINHHYDCHFITIATTNITVTTTKFLVKLFFIEFVMASRLFCIGASLFDFSMLMIIDGEPVDKFVQQIYLYMTTIPLAALLLLTHWPLGDFNENLEKEEF